MKNLDIAALHKDLNSIEWSRLLGSSESSTKMTTIFNEQLLSKWNKHAQLSVGEYADNAHHG